MFKSISKSKDVNQLSATSEGNAVSCMIAKGTTIEGKFRSSDNVRIDGTIKGEVICEQRLLVGATGWIDGSIHAAEATIRGHIKGNIIVTGMLRLENSAKIEGTIVAKHLEVEEGAQYEGECKVGERHVLGAKEGLAMVA